MSSVASYIQRFYDINSRKKISLFELNYLCRTTYRRKYILLDQKHKNVTIKIETQFNGFPSKKKHFKRIGVDVNGMGQQASAASSLFFCYSCR